MSEYLKLLQGKVKDKKNMPTNMFMSAASRLRHRSASHMRLRQSTDALQRQHRQREAEWCEIVRKFDEETDRRGIALQNRIRCWTKCWLPYASCTYPSCHSSGLFSGQPMYTLSSLIAFVSAHRRMVGLLQAKGAAVARAKRSSRSMAVPARAVDSACFPSCAT